MYPVNILGSLRGIIGPEVYGCFWDLGDFKACYFEKHLRHPIFLGALAD